MPINIYKKRLADIVDLNKGERNLMAMWNRYNTQFFLQWLKDFIMNIFIHSFLSTHWARVQRHMDELTRQFVTEKGQELVELGLYRFGFKRISQF